MDDKRKVKRGRIPKDQQKMVREKIIERAKLGDRTRKEIAEEVGVSSHLVGKVLKEFNINLDQVKVYKDRASDIWADKERLIMQHITAEKMKKASLQSLVTSAAICKDKRTDRAAGIQPAGFTKLVLNVDKVFLERSRDVAPVIDVEPILSERMDISDHDRLPLQPVSDACLPAALPDSLDHAPPDPGGGVPGTPDSGGESLCITPVSDAPKQKRSRRKK